MVLRLVITGVPGTGKTTVARALGKKLGMPVISLTDYMKKKKLYSGEIEGELVADLNKLKKALSKEENVIIEGHLACEVKVPDSLVIVLRTRPDVIKERLSDRGYSDKKLRDNMEAEALDYCTIRAEEEYGQKRVYEVDTTGKTVEQVVEECLRIAKGRAGKQKRIDFSDYFLSRGN